MASAPQNLPATVFTPVSTTVPGQPVSQVALLTPGPGLVAPAAPEAGTINFVAATIQQAIISDTLANSAGNTALTASNNFHFSDLTVNVSGDIPGDAFKGITPGITAQFIDLTPDNLLIQGTGPNLFMKSDTGNDLLTVQSGRNILSAGSGVNTMVGGTGQDTFLANAKLASASETIINFAKGDDVAMLGVSLTDFTVSVRDSVNGLQLEFTPIVPTNPISAEIDLVGYKVADIGTKLSLGVGSTADGINFAFLHAN